jgi:hypothetical protein
MIIEQEQILTTHNLAVLFGVLDLTDTLRSRLDDLARRSLVWLCRRLQVKTTGHGRLIQLKNAAYAWRQMLFFLALLPRAAVVDFLGFAQAHLDRQVEPFRDRFRPALAGLALAADGHALDGEAAKQVGARRFLGWSSIRHWLDAAPPA